jgi:hypothetical protein
MDGWLMWGGEEDLGGGHGGEGRGTGRLVESVLPVASYIIGPWMWLGTQQYVHITYRARTATHHKRGSSNSDMADIRLRPRIHASYLKAARLSAPSIQLDSPRCNLPQTCAPPCTVIMSTYPDPSSQSCRSFVTIINAQMHAFINAPCSSSLNPKVQPKKINQLNTCST